MTESLYDVLGVEPAATESEIKNAWRSLVTVLGPTDHRFGSINEAASVLLDADKRAAYDATLIESTPAPTPTPEPAPSVEGSTEVAVTAPAAAEEPAAGAFEESDAPQARVEDGVVRSSAAVGSAPAMADDRGTVRRIPRLGRVIDALTAPRMVVVTGVLAVALIVATSISYLLQDNGPGVSERTITVNLTDANVKPIKQQVTTRETADVTSALAAAVAAAPKILDYDYRTLDTWLQTATAYMTPAFTKTYTPYFTGMVKPNVKRVHGVVKLSPVLDAGVVSTQPGVVNVLIIIDARVETINQAVISQEFATLKMVQVNGSWLVDKFGTAPIPK